MGSAAIGSPLKPEYFRVKPTTEYSKRSRDSVQSATPDVTRYTRRFRQECVPRPALTLVTSDRQLDHAVSLVLGKLSRKN